MIVNITTEQLFERYIELNIGTFLFNPMKPFASFLLGGQYFEASWVKTFDPVVTGLLVRGRVCSIELFSVLRTGAEELLAREGVLPSSPLWEPLKNTHILSATMQREEENCKNGPHRDRNDMTSCKFAK